MRRSPIPLVFVLLVGASCGTTGTPPGADLAGSPSDGAMDLPAPLPDLVDAGPPDMGLCPSMKPAAGGSCTTDVTCTYDEVCECSFGKWLCRAKECPAKWGDDVGQPCPSASLQCVYGFEAVCHCTNQNVWVCCGGVPTMCPLGATPPPPKTVTCCGKPPPQGICTYPNGATCTCDGTWFVCQPGDMMM